MTARTLEARIGSTCKCGEPIRKGEQIRYVKGLAATHERCGDPSEEIHSSGPRSHHSTYRSTRGGGYVRCSHIDYPCCGCGS